jgi:hypothetical protein
MTTKSTYYPTLKSRDKQRSQSQSHSRSRPHHSRSKPQIKRIIPAYRFKLKSSGDGIIQDYVNEILRMIEDDMKQSIESEQTRCRTEISTLFDIPGMTNGRAQRYIYYHVLRALRKEGYIPAIDIKNVSPSEQHVYIHVTWFTKEDTEYEAYMDKFIKSHQVRRPGSGGPAPSQKPISRRRRKKSNAAPITQPYRCAQRSRDASREE